MKLNYEQLIKALDAGEVIEVKSETGRYMCIGGCGKDKFGDYRHSEWRSTIEEYRQYNCLRTRQIRLLDLPSRCFHCISPRTRRVY